MELFTIERTMELDAAHRVPHHESKCYNIHGHRYKVIMKCLGPLAEAGSERGMVIDFGFMKAFMQEIIHDHHDHTTIAWVEDPLVWELLCGSRDPEEDIKMKLREHLHKRFSLKGGLLLTLIPYVPTAENLAKYWFERLAPRIKEHTKDKASIYSLTVYETPNCWATYPAR